jgi:hypothetical protein
MEKIKTYLHTEWIHDNNEYPSHIYSELDEDRYETRKIDLWKDGRIAFAFDDIEYGDTFLGTQPMPLIEDINGIDEWGEEMKAHEITFKEFEQVWQEKVVPLLS